jgi:hypothetical protein
MKINYIASIDINFVCYNVIESSEYANIVDLYKYYLEKIGYD